MNDMKATAIKLFLGEGLGENVFTPTVLSFLDYEKT